MTALSLELMDITRDWVSSYVMLCQAFTAADFSCCLFVGLSAFSFVFRKWNVCSIGFRSGDWHGHRKIFIIILFFNTFYLQKLLGCFWCLMSWVIVHLYSEAPSNHLCSICLHFVVNPLYLLSWSLLLIVDFDSDISTSWRVFFYWLDVVKGFFFTIGEDSPINHHYCPPWTSRPFYVAELTSAFFFFSECTTLNVPAISLMDLFCFWSLTIVCFTCMERSFDCMMWVHVCTLTHIYYITVT